MKTNVYHISFHTAHRLAVLFFFGCNFACRGCLRRAEPFDCHLPEGEKPRKPYLATLTLNEVVNALREVKPEVVVFEGWEPTLDPNLPEISVTLKKELGVKNHLLTNGYLLPKLDGLDEVKVSLKAFSEDLHREYTGRSNRRVLRNFERLYGSGVRLSAETVLIPGYVDKAEIGRIAEFIASVDDEIPLRIDPYWPVASQEWRAPTVEELKEAVEEAKNHLVNVSFLSPKAGVVGRVIRLR
ncbi:MAG: radical SAM protein [Candidatus Nezhaarchaeales archaeon]